MSFGARPTHLARVEVDKLFGAFTYQVRCDLTHGITPIIAPNGRGKTVLLRMIDALYLRRWTYFSRVEFSEFRAFFHDGSSLTVVPLPSSDSADTERGEMGVTTRSAGITVRFFQNGETTLSWKPRRIVAVGRGGLEPLFPGIPLELTGPDLYVDMRTGEQLSLEDLFERYRESLPLSLRGLADFDSPNYSKWLGSTRSLLVEAQRLTAPARPGIRVPARGFRVRDDSDSVVDQLSRKLRELIQQRYAHYTQLAQESDRTFPKRVLQTTDTSFSENDVKERLATLERKREDLVKAGILDHAQGPLALGKIPSYGELLRVLALYVDDTEQKLSVFDDLLRRVTLFADIINSRFAGSVGPAAKRLSVDREKGLAVMANGRSIPLSALSSGEQHLLVLMFDLLFDVTPGSVVLIDEPELSLHVSWQRRFLSDLERVIELNPCQVVLATHSPQLLGNYSDLAVSLGDVDGGESDVTDARNS